MATPVVEIEGQSIRLTSIRKMGLGKEKPVIPPSKPKPKPEPKPKPSASEPNNYEGSVGLVKLGLDILIKHLEKKVAEAEAEEAAAEAAAAANAPDRWYLYVATYQSGEIKIYGDKAKVEGLKQRLVDAYPTGRHPVIVDR